MDICSECLDWIEYLSYEMTIDELIELAGTL